MGDLSKALQSEKDIAYYVNYKGNSIEQTFKKAVGEYSGGYAHMFTAKYPMRPPHRPYTMVIDLKTMKVVATDPRGKFGSIPGFIKTCNGL